MVHKFILAMLYVAWHGLVPPIITILPFCAKPPKGCTKFRRHDPRGDPNCNCNRVRNYFHQRKILTSLILEAFRVTRSRFSRLLFCLPLLITARYPQQSGLSDQRLQHKMKFPVLFVPLFSFVATWKRGDVPLITEAWIKSRFIYRPRRQPKAAGNEVGNILVHVSR